MEKRICKPTLLLDEEKARKNISRMAAKAKKSKVRFRPHFKTHQSAMVAEWFRQAGTAAITVSSVDMALYFAQQGWKDITIAFPVNLLQIDQINALTKQVSLHLLLESEESFNFLKENIAAPTRAWIKIDTGYGRTGIPAGSSEKVLALAKMLANSRNLRLSGLLAHSGNTYEASSPEQIRQIYNDTVHKLNALRDTLNSAGLQPIEISVGDTPACSLVADFSGVDEIRPGNFVFYDLTQLSLGSCSQEEIAVAAACPVVAKHPERDSIVIYGGAVHLSKQSLLQRDGTAIFGAVAARGEKGWGSLIPEAYLKSISQEHGIVHAPPALLQETRIGDILTIIPVHSCLMVNLLRDYYILKKI
ncbi:MAG: alanine racemase [Spirochaeta sp.]|nr:alanine racemase [Spirochaeta sp.]